MGNLPAIAILRGSMGLNSVGCCDLPMRRRRVEAKRGSRCDYTFVTARSSVRQTVRRRMNVGRETLHSSGYLDVAIPN